VGNRDRTLTLVQRVRNSDSTIHMSSNSESPTVMSYSELSGATDFIYRWLPQFTFEIDPANVPQCRAIAGTAGIEVHFPSAVWNHLGFVADLLVGSGRKAIVFLIEHRSAVRSRVRSHKGLFSGSASIREGEHLETEVALSGAYTHFVGMAHVSNSNARDCAQLLSDGTRAFALLAVDDMPLSSELAGLALSGIGQLPGPANLNYAAVITSIAADDSWILRLAGYSGDGDADVQLFVPRDDLLTAEGVVRALLKRAQIS
jgi:hypothetical protein